MPTLPLACGPDFSVLWAMLWVMLWSTVFPPAHMAGLVVAGPVLPLAPLQPAWVVIGPPDPAMFDVAHWRPLWPQTGHGQPPGGAAGPAREGLGLRGAFVLSLLGAAPAATAAACLYAGPAGRPPQPRPPAG